MEEDIDKERGGHHRPRLVSADDTESFSREGFDGHVYVPSSENVGYNVLGVDVHGEHPLKKMLGDTTRIYFVRDGIGTFVLNGVSNDVKEGDLVVIPPEGEYQYNGTMHLLEVNVSPSANIQDQKL